MSSRKFLLENRYPGTPPGIIADPVDVETGEYLSIERTFDPTDAAVFTAIRTVRGSGSSVETVGARFADHPLVDGRLEMFFRQELEFALRPLISSGQIVLEKVEVLKDDDWAELHFHYYNRAAQLLRHGSARVSAIVG